MSYLTPKPRFCCAREQLVKDPPPQFRQSNPPPIHELGQRVSLFLSLLTRSVNQVTETCRKTGKLLPQLIPEGTEVMLDFPSSMGQMGDWGQDHT